MGGRGVENIVSLFHVVAIYFNYTVCPKYILSPQNDMFLVPEPMEYWPAVFSQPLYRLLRIGAAIFKSIGNFEDGFGGKKYLPFITYYLSHIHIVCFTICTMFDLKVGCNLNTTWVQNCQMNVYMWRHRSFLLFKL